MCFTWNILYEARMRKGIGFLVFLLERSAAFVALNIGVHFWKGQKL